MKERQESKSRIRAQFDLSPERVEELDKIRQLTYSPTRQAFLNNALYVYELLIQKALQGSDLQIPIDELKVILRMKKPRQAPNEK